MKSIIAISSTHIYHRKFLEQLASSIKHGSKAMSIGAGKHMHSKIASGLEIPDYNPGATR